jgi:hypothetical protein
VTYSDFVSERPPAEIEGLGQNWMSHHQIPRLDAIRLSGATAIRLLSHLDDI